MDKRFGFREGDLNVILQHIAHFSAINKAIVFGSRAKGNYKTGSDVDIAVWCTDDNASLLLSAELNEETLLPYQFDIVNYAYIDNQELKDHINRVGIQIH